MKNSNASTYSAVQSEHNLHETADFSDLNEVVIKTCDKICEDLAVIYERLLITGCWLNVSKDVANHKEHSHPNNYLSAVYYAEAPKGGDSITFLDPRPQNGVIVPRTRDLSLATGKFVNLAISSGQLVVFPSWLHHSVEGKMVDGVRISVAYNLQFDNCAETMGPPLFSGNFRLFDRES